MLKKKQNADAPAYFFPLLSELGFYSVWRCYGKASVPAVCSLQIAINLVRLSSFPSGSAGLKSRALQLLTTSQDYSHTYSKIIFVVLGASIFL